MPFLFLEMGREEVCRLWDTGILIELCALLILLVALVGAILALRECYRRYCYLVGRSPSYISIKFERSGTGGVGEGILREVGGGYRGTVRRMKGVASAEGEGREETLGCESPGHWAGSYVTFGEVSWNE